MKKKEKKERRRRRRRGRRKRQVRRGRRRKGKSHFYFKGEILGWPVLFPPTVKLPNDNGEMPPKF